MRVEKTFRKAAGASIRDLFSSASILDGGLLPVDDNEKIENAIFCAPVLLLLTDPRIHVFNARSTGFSAR
jgi:hypothetical protein